jgi:hypothetical protein
MTDITNFATDFLQGAEAISEFCRQLGLVDMNPKKVCQWREARKLPVGKVGGHLIASKSAITAALIAGRRQRFRPPPPCRPLRTGNLAIAVRSRVGGRGEGQKTHVDNQVGHPDWIHRGLLRCEGERQRRQFESHAQAKRWGRRVEAELYAGTHTPDSKTATVGEAAQLWLKRAVTEGLEESTKRQYQTHVDLHICPFDEEGFTVNGVKLAVNRTGFVGGSDS